MPSTEEKLVTKSGWLTAAGLKAGHAPGAIVKGERFQKDDENIVYLRHITDEKQKINAYMVFGFQEGEPFSESFEMNSLNQARKAFVARIRAFPGTTPADWTRDLPAEGE